MSLSLHHAYQLGGRYSKGFGKPENHVQSGRFESSLKLTDVSSVHFCPKREFFLGDAQLLSQPGYFPAKGASGKDFDPRVPMPRDGDTLNTIELQTKVFNLDSSNG